MLWRRLPSDAKRRGPSPHPSPRGRGRSSSVTCACVHFAEWIEHGLHLSRIASVEHAPSCTSISARENARKRRSPSPHPSPRLRGRSSSVTCACVLFAELIARGLHLSRTASVGRAPSHAGISARESVRTRRMAPSPARSVRTLQPDPEDTGRGAANMQSCQRRSCPYKSRRSIALSLGERDGVRG
jgi:hypothetical protein